MKESRESIERLFDEQGYLLGPDGKRMTLKMTRGTQLVLRVLAWWQRTKKKVQP